MIVREWIGIIAGVIAIVGYIPYIISILRGKTKPDRATWFIWAVIGGLLALSYFETGDVKAIWVPIGYFLGPFITAILSIRYGYSVWTKLDTVCIIAAGLSLIPWFLSKQAVLTLIINVIIDAAGAIPTLVKTFREPETEDFTAWLIFFFANTLQLFAITQWNLSGIYPLYLFILALMMVLFIVRGKFVKK